MGGGVKSHYIKIDIWFSACKPIIEEFPELIIFYNKTSRVDLIIIGISVDGPIMLPSWNAAIRKYHLPGSIYLILNTAFVLQVKD